MAKKIWLIEQNGIRAIVKTNGFTPKHSIGQAPPEAEDASDLEVVTDTDEMGTERTRIVVNATKRTARLEREAAAKLEAETKEADRKAKRDARRELIRSTNFGSATRAKKDELLAALIEEVFGE